jgi:hypothetical protein
MDESQDRSVMAMLLLTLAVGLGVVITLCVLAVKQSPVVCGGQLDYRNNTRTQH